MVRSHDSHHPDRLSGAGRSLRTIHLLSTALAAVQGLHHRWLWHCRITARDNGSCYPMHLSLIYWRENHRIEIDYLVEGEEHGRGKGKETLVPPPLADSHRPYLVHRLAVYNRFCRSGLVGDSTCHNNLAVFSGAGVALNSYESTLRSRNQALCRG